LQPASNTVADKSDSSAGRLPKSVPTGRALSFPPRRSNDGKRGDTRHGRHDMWPLRAGTVSSIGESAAGRIATELLFSYRNDAQLVLTGIAKAAAAAAARNRAAQLPLASFTSGTRLE
jgi:hypothetical protein